jgi:hypothetical protein
MAVNRRRERSTNSGKCVVTDMTLPYHDRVMTPRGDFGPTDIARENADVLISVGLWLARLLLPIALVCYTVATAVGLRDHVVVTPSLWLHHLGAGYATVSLRHLIVTLTVTFLCVTLESLVLGRNAFAHGEPAAAIATVLAAARRFFLASRQVEMLAVNSTALRAAGRVDNNPDSDILHQLHSALSIAPMAPPLRLTLSSDPWGPFAQSGHRAEVLVAA